MKSKPNNGKKNSRQNSASEAEAESKLQGSAGNQRSAISPDDIDKLAATVGGLLLIVASVVGLTDHKFVALWLFFLAMCCGTISLVAFFHERRLIGVFYLHPFIATSTTIVALAICFCLVHLKFSEAPVITPGNGFMPELPGGRRLADDEFAVVLGSCACIMPCPQDHFVVVGTPTEDLLRFDKRRGVLNISATIYNANKELVCTISNNSLDVGDDGFFKVASTPHRFVVTDATGRVALDISYINKRVVSVLGELYSSSGYKVSITPQSLEIPKVLPMRNQIFTNWGRIIALPDE